MSTILELLEALIAGTAGAGATVALLRAWLTRPSTVTDEPAIDAPEAYDYHRDRLAYHRAKRGEAMRQ